MSKHLQNYHRVSLCYKNACVHAKGSNADKIAAALSIALLLTAIGYLIKINS